VLVIRKDGVPTQGLPGEHPLSNTRQRDGTDHTLKFLVSVFASVGSILYGYDLGVIAGVVASPDFKARFEASGAEEGAVVSVFTGGAFFGAMFAGPAGDLFGRRLTILIGSIIFILGGGLQTGAQSLEYLYAGRVIAGIGVGFLVMIIPLYQAEIAHPSIRGSVTALQQFMLGIGALVASWTTFGTNQNFADNDSMQWRLSLGIQIIPAVVLGLLIMFFPESPRYTPPKL
jgi:MFS family permease